MFHSIPVFDLTFFEIIGISLNTTFHFKSLQPTDNTFIILATSSFKCKPKQNRCNPLLCQPQFFVSPVLRTSKYIFRVTRVGSDTFGDPISKGLTKLAILLDYKCPELICLALPAGQKFGLILVIVFFS